ncbi:hypothetical protein [Fusobacterium sp. PH5-44]|uniref:hypothetical protein n=1 Tax=unclassified Fusobacterium TaxID=2648384 RepID=UPI003D1F5BF2
MLFFKDFIKKIEKNDNIELKEKETFSLETKQKIGKFGIIIPILAIGSFFIYSGTTNKEKTHLAYIFIGAFVCFLGLKQLFTILSYNITIDTVNKAIKSKEINLKFINIESCTLCELGFRRAIKPTLEIIYYDLENKKRLQIPLIMTNKVRFVLCFKKLLGKKFFIKSEN